ncbi:oncoprotein-induced transcript 3 protein-like [Ptychodera flava]|uniref:oncoprotein-induced transcript 3 protein-like n=1 Tax=Ptychodera flava TaxID=63121 RepID=UPI003969DE7A
MIDGICVDPGTPANGEKTADGSVLRFTCQTGYRLVGANEIVCNDGTWSDEVPFCSGVFVTCGEKNIDVVIIKDVILSIGVSNLSLRSSSCRPIENGTHVMFNFTIGTCGTTLNKTNEDMIYENVIRTSELSPSSVIRRYPDVRIPISCTYSRRLKVNMNDRYKIPQKYDTIIDEDNEVGLIQGQFNFFHGEEFQEAYPDEVTVEVNYNEEIYFGIDLTSAQDEETRWKMRTDTCRGSSSADPDDENAISYTFLADGCSMDETLVEFPDDDPLSEKFAIEAFRFRDNEVGNQVYIHCELLVCDIDEIQSMCDKDCATKISRRSSQLEKQQGSMRLSRGPLRIKDDKIDGSKKTTNLLAVIVGVVVMATVVAIVVGVTRYRRKHCGSMDVISP